MSSLDCFDCHELEQDLKILRLMMNEAYQQGRDDAAKSIEALPYGWDGFGLTQVSMQAAIAAARGYGEA